MAELSPAALRAVEDAVRAVVAHDDERLRGIAPDVGDLYVWTRDHGTFGNVELVLPPGACATASAASSRTSATAATTGSC